MAAPPDHDEPLYVSSAGMPAVVATQNVVPGQDAAYRGFPPLMLVGDDQALVAPATPGVTKLPAAARSPDKQIRTRSPENRRRANVKRDRCALAEGTSSNEFVITPRTSRHGEAADL